MKSRLKAHRIPVYDLRLWVGVSDFGKGAQQRSELDWAFGPEPEYQQCSGQVFYERSKFFVQFDPKELSHSLIAHEMFHVANRMLDFVQMPLTARTHESHAYLVGYLTQLVYEDLAKWKIPVSLSAHLAPLTPK
jgi:hypothetical protein